MRTFSRGRLIRIVAQALTLTFFWSATFLGLPILPADAQISVRTASTQSVAVVPFDNRSRFALETLGEEASQAVAVELRDRLRLDVLLSADVALQMRDLGFRPPLNDSELIRLASDLEVTMVVTGEVRSATIVEDRSGRHAQVVLAVRLFDRVAEDSVNGALVETKGPAADGDDTALVRKALEQAAFEAVREMRTRPSVVATVLLNRDDVVYVSAGARSGIQPGTQMAVIRGGQRIALIEVNDADPLGSYAKLIAGPALRPGDQCRAIYRLPTRAGAPSPEKVYRKKRNLETLIVGFAAMMGVVNIGSAGRLVGEGSIAAPGFFAANLANGLALAYSAQGSRFDPGLPAVLCSFEPYADPTEKTRVVGFEIWNDFSGLVMVTTPVEGGGGAGPEWNRVVHYLNAPDILYFVASLTILPDTGQMDFGLTLEAKDPDEDVAYGVFWAEGATTIDYVWPAIGPQPGIPTQYWIQPVLAVEIFDPTDGSTTWALDRGTEYTSQINRIVPVSPPRTDTVYISGMTASFYFYTPRGANEAIVQIARDPNDTFPPGQVYSRTISGTWTDQDWYSLEHIDVDLNQVLALPGEGDRFWYRIGSRNRNDSVHPRPYPLTEYNDYNWVWSDVQRITLWQSTSAQAVHRQRAAMAKSQFGRTRLLARHRRDRPLRVQ